MITPPRNEPEAVASRLVVNSSAEVSERKLPAAIENASTKMRMRPVRRIISRATPAIATPESNPTVETRLSSTPKMKLRKYAACIRKSYHRFKKLGHRRACAKRHRYLVHQHAVMLTHHEFVGAPRNLYLLREVAAGNVDADFFGRLVDVARNRKLRKDGVERDIECRFGYTIDRKLKRIDDSSDSRTRARVNVG